MPKETVAILGLGLTLIAAVFGFGLRIGSLTEQVEALQRQQNLHDQELGAINQHFILYAAQHGDAR